MLLSPSLNDRALILTKMWSTWRIHQIDYPLPDRCTKSELRCTNVDHWL